jgi:hypothetical protein
MKTFLISLMILGMQVKAFGATVTINLEANLLKTASGDPMPTTGLVILVANINSTSFSQPTDQQFVTGGNTIVGTWDLSEGWDVAGVLGAVANFGLLNGLAAGDPLQLYWFPTLTIDSTAPGAGTPYGLYTDPVGIANSEGGEQSAPWFIPGGGNTVDFYFLTADANSGFDAPGLNPASAGLASSTTLGTWNVESQTWGGGDSYTWEINNAEGTAGASGDSGWDWMNISGTLAVIASSESPFTINFVTLNGNLAGSAANFNNTHCYGWPIATASGGISGPASTVVTVDASGFQNSWSGAGTFGVATYGNSVYVVYTPNPPTTFSPLDVYVHSVDDSLHMIFENLAGLSAVSVSTEINCAVTCTAYNEAGGTIASGLDVLPSAKTTLPPGTTKAELIATKVTPGDDNATVNTFAYDFYGLSQTTDPSMATLLGNAADALQQRLEGIPSAEHYLQLNNGAPGLASLQIAVNGHYFGLGPLNDSQSLVVDLGAYMNPGAANTVVLTGSGVSSASAVILLADGISGVPMALPPLPAIARGESGLALSWADPLAQWQLQESPALGAGWADVSTVPASANGVRTVAVSGADAAKFFRLRGASGVVSGAQPPASAGGNAITVTLPTTNRSLQTIKTSYGRTF